MRDSEKEKWTRPTITRFKDADELWEHYKHRGTPEQRARLRAWLDVMARGETHTEVKRRRAS